MVTPYTLWYEEPRELTVCEENWIKKLLSADLKDKDILLNQVQHSKVIGQCTCGCKSVNIEIDKSAEKYPYPERVPVEMIVNEPGNAPILFLLHVVDGYINELEVLRADSSPLNDDIDVSNVEVQININ